MIHVRIGSTFQSYYERDGNGLGCDIFYPQMGDPTLDYLFMNFLQGKHSTFSPSTEHIFVSAENRLFSVKFRVHKN